jgi:hypothetical protein
MMYISAVLKRLGDLLHESFPRRPIDSILVYRLNGKDQCVFGSEEYVLGRVEQLSDSGSAVEIIGGYRCLNPKVFNDCADRIGKHYRSGQEHLTEEELLEILAGGPTQPLPKSI